MRSTIHRPVAPRMSSAATSATAPAAASLATTSSSHRDDAIAGGGCQSTGPDEPVCYQEAGL